MRGIGIIACRTIIEVYMNKGLLVKVELVRWLFPRQRPRIQVGIRELARIGARKLDTAKAGKKRLEYELARRSK